MLMRLLRWRKNHPIGFFFFIIFFPLYGIIVHIIVTISVKSIQDWYYEKFPFSNLAVWLFAEPGEDTLMFRYRLGDRLLFIRSDMAEPAWHWGADVTRCNPLWGECQVRPMSIVIRKTLNKNEICIGRYLNCSGARGLNHEYDTEFWIYAKNNIEKGNVFNDLCSGKIIIYNNKIFNYNIIDGVYGFYKNYFIDKIVGNKENICGLTQYSDIFDSLLTAMENGNYSKFPRKRE
jgi:hypothetical protein